MDGADGCNIKTPGLACFEAVLEVLAGLFAMSSNLRTLLNVDLVREPVD